MRNARTTIVAAVLLVAACSGGKKDDAGTALARDTALAADLKQAADTAAFSEAADVSMRDIPDSTLPMPPGGPVSASPTMAPTMRTGAPSRAATTTSTTTRTTTTSPSPAQAPAPAPIRPSAPHPVPIPVTPPPVRPAPDPAPRSVAAAPADAGSYITPACASPAMSDQRRCLLAYLARSDVALDRNYQARIAQLRSEAGTRPGDPEPARVQQLRQRQRAWLVYRDTECRNRNRGKEGPLWAPTRARCLAEFSDARADELR